MKGALTGHNGALAQAQVTDSVVSPHEALAPQKLTLSCSHGHLIPFFGFPLQVVERKLLRAYVQLLIRG